MFVQTKYTIKYNIFYIRKSDLVNKFYRFNALRHKISRVVSVLQFISFVISTNNKKYFL